MAESTNTPIYPLIDQDGNQFYPSSHAKAIKFTDGTTVEDRINRLEGYATATLSGNGYVLDIDFNFAEGSRLAVKFVDASTISNPYITIGDVQYPIKKKNGNPASIAAGEYDSLICSTDSFIFLGEGGEYGSATATDVLAGKTLGTENGLVDGTIPVITGAGNGDCFDALSMTVGAFDDGDTTNYLYLGVTPDAYYDGINWVRKAEPNLVASCIKSGASIFGVNGSASVVDTSDGTITADLVPSGYVGYSQGARIVGTATSKAAETFVPSTTNQTIPAGTYLSGDQVIVGDANFVESNIKYNVSMFGKTGTFTSDGTLAANKMLSGIIGYSKGTKYTGTIASKGATTITPGTSNQTISSGVYLSGTITILGSSNLVSGNIKSGVKIFNVTGSMAPDALTTSSYKVYQCSGADIINNWTLYYQNSYRNFDYWSIVGNSAFFENGTYGLCCFEIPSPYTSTIIGFQVFYINDSSSTSANEDTGNTTPDSCTSYFLMKPNAIDITRSTYKNPVITNSGGFYFYEKAGSFDMGLSSVANTSASGWTGAKSSRPGSFFCRGWNSHLYIRAVTIFYV